MDKDKLYLAHILEAIGKIRRYTHDVTFNEFKNSDLIQDAVVRELEIIGEASRHVSEAAKEKYPNIPW